MCCSKHARRHPNFDPTVLRQRRAAVKAFSVNSSDGTPSEHSVPSPWARSAVHSPRAGQYFIINSVIFSGRATHRCGRRQPRTAKFVKSAAILVWLSLHYRLRPAQNIDTVSSLFKHSCPTTPSNRLTRTCGSCIQYRSNPYNPKTFFSQFHFMNKLLAHKKF